MNNRIQALAGFIIVTVAETAGLCLWLWLVMRDQPLYGILCLVAGETIEWVLLAGLIARSNVSHPLRTGKVRSAIILVGAIAGAEVVLWVGWSALADRNGIALATFVLFVVMHIKHVSEISIVSGRKLLPGVLSVLDVCATIAEVGGAAVWYILFKAGEPVLASTLLFICMGIEHYLQFMVGGIFQTSRTRTSHVFLTIAIPFSDERANDVDHELDRLGNPAEENVRDALRQQGIHFLSLTVLRGQGEHATFLLLEASVDGTDSRAIGVVAERFGDLLRPVLENAGIPVDSSQTLDRLLQQHSCRVGTGLFSTPGLNFTGSPGMSADRIRKEYLLARLVRKIIEQDDDVTGTALQKLKVVRELIGSDDELSSLLTSEPITLLEPAQAESPEIGKLVIAGVIKFLWPVLLVAIVLVIATVVVTIPAVGTGFALLSGFGVFLAEILGLAVVAVLAYGRLRQKERTDPVDDSLPDPDVLTEIMRRENAREKEQNHMAGVSVMKIGFLRNLTLRIVFWAIGELARSVSRPGFLGELGTIHFARWILLPGTNKLLFFSNYGGSWESYLEDFITKAHGGLTGVWSNTVGFPRTKNIFGDGATDGDRFKRWARRQQQPTRVWYSAYPYLTTERIRINAAIRHGLAIASTEDQAATWLSCIGSRPRPAGTIETTDVQKILFGRLRPLAYAECLLLSLPSDVDQARAWLRGIEQELSFGDGPPKDCERMLGLTHTGLSRLGLSDKSLQEFPIAFTQGMSVEHRARILGDTGDDKPSVWWWGHGDNSVDAVLLVYHRSQQGLEDDVSQQSDRIQQYQGELVHRVVMQVIDLEEPTREPFDFVDGISQPIIRGSRQWTADSDPIHVVAPGEFILGYPDNRGQFPWAPTVPATVDPHSHLAALQQSISESLVPTFESIDTHTPRDLGRNGTFLVIRQLEQDVEKFNGFLSEAAEKLIGRPGLLPGADERQMTEWVAAKMVGRWRDGTSLIRFPDHPGNGWPWEQADTKVPPDNSFLSGQEDPLGYRCPFGAHIRRTNPRDSLSPQSMEQVSITNRHRILRVGRPYKGTLQPDSRSEKPGLLFMCLNADIERQFEFIQQTWAMSRSFHGLDGEVDSIIGRGLKGGRISIPTPEGPILLTSIIDFVTVRGGSYFFVPSHRAVRFLSSGKGHDT